MTILPLVTLEIWTAAAAWLSMQKGWGPRMAPTSLAILILMWAPADIEGYGRLDGDGAVIDARMDELVAEVETLPPGPILTDNAALLWRTRRCGVWVGGDAEIVERLRGLMPGLRDAPHVAGAPSDLAGDGADDAAEQAER